MPLVWGVFPWKRLVLASDMNSGLWVFRVTGDANGGNGGTSSPAPQAAPAPAPRAAPDPPATPTSDSGDPGSFLWVGLAGLVLGLLAVGVVVRAARRRSG
jgi:hypothetical protein